MNLPPYFPFPTLFGERITLREVVDSDINDILPITYYDGVQAESLEAGIEILKKISDNYQEGDSIHWGIVDNLTNKVVGTCGYYRGFSNNAGEIGCVLLPEYRSQGYMLSALQLIVDFGIKDILLDRIWAITSLENEKAINLLNSLDFKRLQLLPEDNVEYEYLSNIYNK